MDEFHNIRRKMILDLQQQQIEDQIFRTTHGQLKPPRASRVDNLTIYSEGPSLIVHKRSSENEYTFFQMIHDHALKFFGKDFLEEQNKTVFEKRHEAIKWLYKNQEYFEKVNKSDQKDNYLTNGAGVSWIRLAYDIFTIKDNSELEKKIRHRIIHGDFQAARHELWVAALYVTAGFIVCYEDETNNKSSHVEFTAIHKHTNIEIAVEAKSRHRKNVKGFSGGKDVNPLREVNIKDIILKSYEKRDNNKKIDNLPFYAVIDLNLPSADDEKINGWISEIYQTIEDLRKEGYDNPNAVNALIFINDPSHYLEEYKFTSLTDSPWISTVMFQSPVVNHPNFDILKSIYDAFSQRIKIPSNFINM